MEWVRGKNIGHGSFAAVSLARPTSTSTSLPSLIAVKSCGVSHSDSLKNERVILEELKDCNEIIKCFGDSVTLENGQRLYNVALEYASGGDLSSRVKNSGSLKMSENEVKKYTNSILKGVEFIHKNGFVHCDIKMQNILLASDNNGKEVAKIADFGLAKRTANIGEVQSKYEIRGTPMYMAPETVISGEQEFASDIWAVGCLVTEMITGNPVWNCSDVSALLMKIGAGSEIPEIPGKLSDAGKDFLAKCFIKDSNKRWTAEMLLNHEFLNNVSFDEEVENQVSPRDIFDFPDWESEQSCSSSTISPESSPESVIAPAMRLGQLLTEQKPNWSVNSSWLKVR